MVGLSAEPGDRIRAQGLRASTAVGTAIRTLPITVVRWLPFTGGGNVAFMSPVRAGRSKNPGANVNSPSTPNTPCPSHPPDAPIIQCWASAPACEVEREGGASERPREEWGDQPVGLRLGGEAAAEERAGDSPKRPGPSDGEQAQEQPGEGRRGDVAGAEGEGRRQVRRCWPA